ncbi:MAG: META domain-containing protein [Chitinophagales bacterium]|nr:META domain-containing protein [Chitinophagales bacterium]
MKKSFLLLMTTYLMACTISGCSKENEIVIPSENWISLSEIPENVSFALLPLISTKWKLVGYADEALNSFRHVETSGLNDFTLIFEKGGKIDGFTSANILSGKFSHNANSLQIDSWTATEVGEGYYGELYVESLNKVYTYRINKKGLILYLAEDTAMLFHPID